ncbi:ABC transporter permease [Bogoriella caseilytica]|uniref:Putative ABC transport system permease protein n=1 Tax=Bogoriella caseilytica TaxID=56055 RepID=A0A3N2BB27_9MICO|nr:ABC transporter permease [Bogoriella caseilytica]ROR72284.1 putative ABC transport system permease protein [Bogoriella caseilytica]
MKLTSLVATAFGNTLRSKLRTALTVIAIVIGAFTLTLTFGLGAGINATVDRIVAGFGESDELYVLPATSVDATEREGPPEYDPQAGEATNPMGQGMGVLTDDQLDTIRGIDHVLDVDPVLMTQTDFLETSAGERFELNMDMAANGALVEMVAGDAPARTAMEMTIPEDWITIFGASTPEEAIGETVLIGVSNVVGEQSTLEAEVVGVTAGNLAGAGFDPVPSVALTEEIYAINGDGYQGERQDAYIMAVVTVDDFAENEQAVKDDLLEEDMWGLSVEDQISMFQAVIDAVTWVLSGFALIALLAASFGIVNTLLMSVQERTREIGLMKALGMSSGRVFGLFSLEAVAIGVMGSVLGVGAGLGTGLIADALLTGEDGPLGGFAELSLFGINVPALAGTLGLIVVIAFLAGTLPAVRAARKDPIEALRYE